MWGENIVPRSWRRTPTVAVLVAVLALAGAPSVALAAGTPTPAATGSPSGSGTPIPAPATSGDGAIDEHAAAQLIAATAALQAAESDLAVARAQLATAEAARAAAEAAATQAQTDLRAATIAETNARTDVEAVQVRIAAQNDDLGRLARTAYEASGPLETWGVMLDSKTPTELANRASMLGSVASIGNARLGRLEESRADLVDARDRLIAATAQKQLAVQAADQAVAARQADELAAQSAAAQVTTVVAVRRAAYAAAVKAQQIDMARYRVMVAVSGRLGERIREAAATFAKGPNPPQGTGQMDRPGRGEITSPFGLRYHPILHYVKLHTGTDFAQADGIVYAADDGVVLLTEFNVAYGNMTVMGHGSVGTQGIATLYAHQAALFVRAGDRVKKGQPIGLIGATGYATGPHLHFEVRVEGKPVDPMPWLAIAPMPPVPTTLPPPVPLLVP